jgi:hypothetical protein
MRKRLAGLAFPVTVAVLILGILGVGVVLATVALPDMLKTGAAASAAPSVRPSTPVNPQPTSAMGLSPIGIAMPSDANCGACHTTASGGVGIKTIPMLAHPLKGFANCTACHNPEGLVKTAPGHSSLHANECLVCHQENPKIANMTAPPARPEHMSGAACTTCHGVDKHAPLPSDMAGRGNNCWICHNGPEFQYLFNSAAPSATPAAPAASGSPAPAPSGSPAPSASPSAPSGYYLLPPATKAP